MGQFFSGQSTSIQGSINGYNDKTDFTIEISSHRAPGELLLVCETTPTEVDSTGNRIPFELMWNLKSTFKKIIIKKDVDGTDMLYLFTKKKPFTPPEGGKPFRMISFRLKDARKKIFSEAIKAHESKIQTRQTMDNLSDSNKWHYTYHYFEKELSRYLALRKQVEAADKTLSKFPPIMDPEYKLTEEEESLINRPEQESLPKKRSKRRNKKRSNSPARAKQEAIKETHQSVPSVRADRRLAGTSPPALGAPVMSPLSLTLLSAGMVLGGILCFRCFRKRHRARLLPRYEGEESV